MFWTLGLPCVCVVPNGPSIPPNSKKFTKSEHHPYAAHIAYREGVAHRTGLPDRCADIVTCAQSLHWMEPTSTLAEIAGILRPGGLFAAYDYDWPPSLNWELERVSQEVGKRLVELLRERGLAQNLKVWPKETHLDRMRESTHFRFTREVLLHQIEQGDARSGNCVLGRETVLPVGTRKEAPDNG